MSNLHEELIYQLALTTIPNIGTVQARILLDKYGTASNIFCASYHSLRQTDGIGDVRAAAIKSFRDFSAAQDEKIFMAKYQISCCFMNDPGYPKRLLDCYDAPLLLFYKGSPDMNAARTVAVIGTRNNSGYGRDMTEQLISKFSEHDIQVISGLAYGIDALAHTAALSHNLSTIGVLAHSLDQVYPYAHKSLATAMCEKSGGLITEFRSGTLPDRHNFPTRNRIVAGMSDAVIVIETHEKGGSMITAGLANGYNKEVFAFPGKTTDARSMGCNQLIRENKAQLITSAEDVLDSMNWLRSRRRAQAHQQQLFPELNDAEKRVVAVLGQQVAVSIDEINERCGLSSGVVAAAILRLEIDNLVLSLPGKRYQLC